MCVLICSCEKGNTMPTSKVEDCVVHGIIDLGTITTSSSINSMIGDMAKEIGVPSSCVEMLTCADCGKSDIAAHFSWDVDLDTLKYTGPHCGCLKQPSKLPDLAQD